MSKTEYHKINTMFTEYGSAYGENDSNKDLMIVFDAPQKKESKV